MQPAYKIPSATSLQAPCLLELTKMAEDLITSKQDSQIWQNWGWVRQSCTSSLRHVNLSQPCLCLILKGTKLVHNTPDLAVSAGDFVYLLPEKDLSLTNVITPNAHATPNQYFALTFSFSQDTYTSLAKRLPPLNSGAQAQPDILQAMESSQPASLQPANLHPANLQPANLQPNLQPANPQPANLQPTNLQPANPQANLQPANPQPATRHLMASDVNCPIPSLHNLLLLTIQSLLRLTTDPQSDAILVQMQQEQILWLLWRSGLPIFTGKVGLVAKIRKLVEEKPDYAWSTQDLAEQLYMSERNLRRQLAGSGHSCSQLIRLSRLHVGLGLLQQGYKNIEEVAYACGYASRSRFSQRFQEQFGLPPTTWQQRGASLTV